MMRLRSCVLILLTLASPALADEKLLSSEIEFYDQSADGKPAICGVEYTYLFDDKVYEPGMAALHLTISFFKQGMKFLAGFKFAGAHFPNGVSKPPVTFPIANASVSIMGENTPLFRSQCAIADNSFCGSIAGDTAVKFLEALAAKQAKLVFNRAAGQLDYSFDINISQDKFSSFDSFYIENGKHAKCMLSIMNN